MQPVDQKLLDGSKSDGSDTWKINAMKKVIPIFDLIDNYTYWLIPKFILIAKGTRFTPKRLAKMIIGDGITSQEKDLLIDMLYN